MKPRSWPYWQPISKGKAIGFYRTPEGGTWRARIRTPQGKHLYESLGGELGSEYEDMLEKANAWFLESARVQDMNYTVAQCVDDYIEAVRNNTIKKKNNRSSAQREESAKRSKQLLEKHLIPRLGTVRLSKLTREDIETWLNGLVRQSDDPEDVRRSMDSANRILSQFKAALNVAFANGVINSKAAWEGVGSFKGVAKARDLFLTDKQVKRMMEKAEGQLRNLIQAAILTGARYGELRMARVRDFDRKTGTLYLNGKTGERWSTLSTEAIAFFKALAKDRLPEAWLLVKDNGEPWGPSHHSRDFRALVNKAKLPKETVFYSLRHYHISRAINMGMPVLLIARNCGTSARMIETNYLKEDINANRAYLDQVALI